MEKAYFIPTVVQYFNTATYRMPNQILRLIILLQAGKSAELATKPRMEEKNMRS